MQLEIKGKVTEQFSKKLQKNLPKAQRFVDSEVLRRCGPLIPFKTGSLKRSGITGTKIGSGRIRYTAPYARTQYYKGRTRGQRGPNWMGRMKVRYGKKIAQGAKAKLMED